MARSMILGNSSLTVGLDENGLVHDFYYPYVGLENLTTARSKPHHVGVWVDGEFSWVHSSDWKKELSFNSDALVSNIAMSNKKLGVSLHFEDFVDASHDIFCRKVRVINDRGTTRNVRVFFHQVFQISALGRADTAMYVPDGHYILDYKGRCSLLAYAENELGEPFDQFAVGNAGIEGKEGTFRDAEDGELSMSAVEHASVDSTLRVSLQLLPHASEVVRYWLAASDSQDSLEQLHEKMLDGGFEKRLEATLQHWHDWLSIAEKNLPESIPENYAVALKKSLLVIKAHTDEHGGIIASCDSSIYNYGRDYYSYVWPRDGAYVMWPLIKLGYKKEPRKFFEFCASILHPDGYLKHKYQPDRAVGSTWHPLLHNKRRELAIQEDETAIVLYMLAEYEKHTGDSEFIDEMYERFIQPAAEFMCRFVDDISGLPHASYDLWEEKLITSTYTTAVVTAALRVASGIANRRGVEIDAKRWSEYAEQFNDRADTFFDEDENHFIKGYLIAENSVSVDTVLDISSFYGAFMFNFGSKDFVERTLQEIETTLFNISPSGGTARYEHDNYFKSDPAYLGNPWYVTTLWLAQYYATHNHIDLAKDIVSWALKHTLASGTMSEQINPTDGSVVGVTPLVWSHAELVNTILLMLDSSVSKD